MAKSGFRSRGTDRPESDDKGRAPVHRVAIFVTDTQSISAEQTCWYCNTRNKYEITLSRLWSENGFKVRCGGCKRIYRLGVTIEVLHS